ncbi:MAG: hypothetical protein Q8916_03195 [Bacteroidota bacterium]|nr:hypothetical protein [Bacteroidota bacterium]MDP4229394.1 hypothetical protein [Bacteroidota bacterium]
MTKKYIILIVALGWFCSCSNSSSSDSSSDSLLGVWQWANTSGGIAGMTYTPSTEGFAAKMVVSASSNYGLYRNDTLVRSGIYTVDTVGEKDHFHLSQSGDSIFFKQLPHIVLTGAMQRSNDSLIIWNDSISDGFSSLFIRKK